MGSWQNRPGGRAYNENNFSGADAHRVIGCRVGQFVKP